MLRCNVSWIEPISSLAGLTHRIVELEALQSVPCAVARKALISLESDMRAQPSQADHDVTLLHYDADFEIAAEVLPFQHRWALGRGSIS